ncbi:hypothetical protein TPHA_0D04660 [Tetrapisispora phaffii CBS 4417]|uniref:ubiquitinyl hydrolase 1 n=1 Tax=Tetrapisispora phaffii (strain ATCC 24235 / CBS 4417 / NBRC 1672 / NRRL Y-8282 / UCD 70-5) TaxID=1071381 RepID=G8BS25_TETPH|nr:hypothetical protein TPHA_0D04660 [Tetrapisispora phaffii CBS 4417]CCE63100.1 hypothetical protein TPHA_0D04660 [Tetrapisispora phaffii CBS 4417]
MKVESTFTPEYSNELLKRVSDTYNNEIKGHFPQLRLTKLIEMLEHTAYLLESYLDLLHEQKYDECLSAYIVGCFYLYLIIPNSTQFQIRNKSFRIYNELKILYQNQANMTNVLAIVKNEVDSILDESILELEGIEKVIKRDRAYSSPAPKVNNISKFSKLSINDNHHNGETISTDNKLQSHFPQTPNYSNSNNSTGSFNNVKSNSNSSEEAEDTAPIWHIPSLEPNDQLKLALEQPVEFSDEEIDASSISEPLGRRYSPLSPYQKKRNSSISSAFLVPFPHNENDKVHDNSMLIEDLPVDRSVTHRKDSYHSVYMNNQDEESDSGAHYGLSNSYIQSMDRLQKQNVITCSELYSILSSPTERQKLLLVDLRIPKASRTNHIIAPHIIKIDPNLLWNEETQTPIYSFEELVKRINNPLISEVNKFDYIVYYSDIRTFMVTDYDFCFTFFYLLLSTKSLNLKQVPTNLLGGFEKWKKVLKTYNKEYGIDITPFIKKLHATELNKNTVPTGEMKTLEATSWKQPEVPLRIRKRPPPPPPSSIPEIPSTYQNNELTTLIEDKRLENIDVQGKHRRIEYISPPIPPRTPSPNHQPSYNQKKHQYKALKSYATPVPTIEQNPNTYVSLSITGLRNLGNTCYISSMLQCLFATTTLRDLFITTKYESYINHKVTDKINLSRSFSILFRKMYLNGGCSVVPASFLKTCNQLRPDLKIPDDQQDTQEFLMLVLDRLHDELSKEDTVLNDYSNLLLYDAERMHVKVDQYKKWFENSNLSGGVSPIDDIFQGQIENSINCQRCGYSSFNYSSFYVLSLAIPKISVMSFSRTNRVKLEDCINMFTRDEVLSGENAWDCSRCGSQSDNFVKTSHNDHHKEHTSETTDDSKQNRKSRLFLLPKKYNPTSRSLSPFGRHSSHKSSEKWKSKKMETIKSLNFIKMPKILVIHLSRFFYDMSKKNETVVAYPLILNIVLKNEEVCKYRLYAIVNHMGNQVASGHYTTLVNKNRNHDLGKNEQQWYYFDDEVVKHELNHGNIDEGVNKVSSSHVYVLFYEKID